MSSIEKVRITYEWVLFNGLVFIIPCASVWRETVK